jgi:uncharacterized Rmd1/YagE family protein
MAVLTALAYGFATTFKMRELAPCFAGARLRQAKSQIVAEYAADRFAVAFDFGAIVFINVAGEERARVLGTVLSRVATDEPHPPLEEDFLVEVREGVTPAVRFDRVIVPGLDAAVLDVITLLLGQSVSIDYYDEDLQEILASLDSRTDKMAATGRLPGSPRALTRFIGATLSTKNQIIAALAVLDKPAVTWEAEALDKLYNELRSMLEIDERFRALEYKMRTVQDTLEVILDLGNTRRSHFLEIIVVILILIEVALGLMQLR